MYWIVSLKHEFVERSSYFQLEQAVLRHYEVVQKDEFVESGAVQN